MVTAQRRRDAQSIRLAIAVSLAVHCVIIWFLVNRGPPLSLRQFDNSSVPVELVNPFSRARRPPPPPEPRHRRYSMPSGSPVSPRITPPSQPTHAPTIATPAAPSLEPSKQPIGDARLSLALRRSGVGCANADAVNLSEAEREACRRRLADGAGVTPFISGVPTEKSQYYVALQESEAEMNRSPTGGHLPGIVCGGAKKRLGLKVGPCTLAAPLSPWTPEADVQRP
jgi:hypothetical protein